MGSVATGRIYIIVRRMIGSWMIDSVMRDTRSIATRLKRAQRINRSFEPLDTTEGYAVHPIPNKLVFMIPPMTVFSLPHVAANLGVEATLCLSRYHITSQPVNSI